MNFIDPNQKSEDDKKEEKDDKQMEDDIRNDFNDEHDPPRTDDD